MQTYGNTVGAIRESSAFKLSDFQPEVKEK